MKIDAMFDHTLGGEIVPDRSVPPPPSPKMPAMLSNTVPKNDASCAPAGPGMNTPTIATTTCLRICSIS
jgi:hypothetical protein